MKSLLFLLLFAATSCTTRYALVNTAFHDLANTTSGKLSRHYVYQFGENTYAIEWMDETSIPKCKYIIEEGMYKLEGRNLVLSPQVKVFCEIFPITKNIPCTSIGHFDGAHFVHRDTLPQSEISRLGFNDRTVSIMTSEGKPMFMDAEIDNAVYSLAKSTR